MATVHKSHKRRRGEYIEEEEEEEEEEEDDYAAQDRMRRSGKEDEEEGAEEDDNDDDEDEDQDEEDGADGGGREYTSTGVSEGNRKEEVNSKGANDSKGKLKGDPENNRGVKKRKTKSKGKQKRRGKSITSVGTFERGLRAMMYGFGDAKNPYVETVQLVGDLATEFIEDMTKSALEVSQNRLVGGEKEGEEGEGEGEEENENEKRGAAKTGRAKGKSSGIGTGFPPLDVDSLIHVVRRDKAKEHRAKELLKLYEDIKTAKKSIASE